MITLTKLNERTSRPSCRRCGSSGNEGFYWALSESTNNNVLMERTDLTMAIRKGDPMPVENVHKCFLRDAGLPSDSDAYVSEEEQQLRERRAADDARQEAANDVPDAPQQTEAAAPAAKPYVRGENPLADAIRDIVGPVQIDKAEVENIAREIIGGYVFPTKTVVIREGERREIPGLQHNQMPRVLGALSVGLNALLVGPAGTGKSHIAGQCATFLGVDFYSMSLTSQTGESKFTGFVDARGEYHNTVVFEWASNPNGGVLCLDELDNGNPNILGWLNALLANRFVRFENGETYYLTDKHYVVGTGNTYGFGRNREYVGRNPIDAATKNRFVTITIPIDEALETALVHGTGVKPATGDKILSYVRKLRASADAKGVNIVMSPRNSVGMAKLLMTDVYDWDMAVEDQIRCGIEDKVWDKIAA